MSDKQKDTSKDVEKNAGELSEETLNNVVGGVIGDGGCTDHIESEFNDMIDAALNRNKQ